MNDGPGSVRETIRRRAPAVATGVAAAPFVVWFVLLPGALGILVTDWAFGTGSLAIETLVVVVLMSATFVSLWWAFASGGIRSLLRLGRLGPTVRATTLAIFAVVSFTSLTALLHDQGIVGVTPEPAHDQVLGVTFEFYAWQFANTVPLLDIPGNLHWDKPFEFDDQLGGLLVILFTGFVIFPLIQLARLILAGGDVRFDVTVLRALSKYLDRDRISVVRRPEGYGLAIVDKAVIIDVMSAVWNHDAVVQRLERLGARPAMRRLPGYLLVVDAIAGDARQRVEVALSQAPWEASLAVWRPDQPAEDLTDALDALEERIEPPQVEGALPSS